MNILFAAPHRDLNRCYQQILSDSLGQVTTAFDGTQVLTLLNQQKFDLVIFDQNLPRIPIKQLIETSRQNQIPVLLLLDTDLPDAGFAPEDIQGSLSYPFYSGELIGLIQKTMSAAQPA